MLRRIWLLLSGPARRSLLRLVPLIVLSALVEVVGVAVVIPFLSLLADPGAFDGVPVVGALLAPRAAADPAGLLVVLGVAVALSLTLANALVALTSWSLYRLSWGLNHELSSRLLERYLSQPYSFVLRRNSADLVNRITNEVRQVVTNGVQAGLDIVARGAVTLALVAFLVALDPLLAITAFLTIGLAYLAIFRIARRYLRRISTEAVVNNAARYRTVNEAIGGFKDLKVSGREHAALASYLPHSRRYGEVQAASMAISNLPRYGLEAVAIGGLVVISALFAGAAGNPSSVVPMLGAYAFAGLRLMPAMQHIFASVSRLRFSSASLDAVERDLLDRGAEREPFVEALPPPCAFHDRIELEGVTYGYPGSATTVLESVSFVLRKHQSLAIVGRTGSGKTTLVDILLGLLPPSAGRVLLDGVDAATLPPRAYRRVFGYVPQHIFLLDDTVTRNIAFKVPVDRIDMGAVRRAAEMAQVARFVEEDLADGYETIVGERGIRLSGGQRQRIGIARALYADPEVLVFDEATSSLDVHTERTVFEALEAIARSKTLVTIAHRLETIVEADVVLVLERGRLVDSGPAAEVVGRFRAEVGA